MTIYSFPIFRKISNFLEFYNTLLTTRSPHGFVILDFTMFDGSADPYDHMLIYNQAMTLNANNDSLLCKVFPTSLLGPTLAWFHKLLPSLINSFNEL